MDYVILGVRDRAYLLAREDDPDASARLYAPGIGLSGVHSVVELLKLGYWEPYLGPQEPLPGIPERVFTALPRTA
ncbi:MAG TPA: hypothetical protein VMH50_14325 [Thermoleophilia bacterium]|nr:hypothetical protein [Thermoleophilia bacterium]